MPGDAIEVRRQAEAERKAGRLEQARSLYEQSVNLMLEGAVSPGLLAHTVRHLGDVCAEAGDLESAERHIRHALATCTEFPEDAPPLDIANAIRSLAVVRGRAGAIDEARQLWTDARNRYAALGIEEGVAGTTRQLQRLGAVG